MKTEKNLVSDIIFKSWNFSTRINNMHVKLELHYLWHNTKKNIEIVLKHDSYCDYEIAKAEIIYFI